MDNATLPRDSDIIRLSKDPVKLIIWVAIVAGVTWFVTKIFATVLIFSFALLFAYLISPMVRWVCSRPVPGTRWRIPWVMGTLLVYSVFLLAAVLLAVYLVPLIVSQATELANQLPVYVKKSQQFLEELQLSYQRHRLSPALEESIKKYGSQILDRAGLLVSQIAVNVAGGVLRIFSAVLILISALIFSLYLVLDEKKIKLHFLDMFPESWRDDTVELMHNVGQIVGAYIRGQLLLGFFIGLGSFVVLVLLRLIGIRYDYALLTGLAVAVLYPIPFVGVWLPRFAAPILAYFQAGGWMAAFWVFVGLSTWGGLADNLLLPWVMGRGIGIPPFMVLLVAFAGGELFGFWGLILSIPAAAIIRLIFFYVQKHFEI